MCKTELGEEFSNPNPISIKLHKGMPTVELTEDDKLKIHLNLHGEMSKQITAAARKGPITITLESLDLDRVHNQSFGMVAGSTGCVSNPGGPSC